MVFPKSLSALFLAAVPAAAAPPTGGISRHVWTSVGGTAVANLTSLPTFPASPSTTNVLTSFSAPVNWADNYGTRVFGWVHAPVTGNYVFYLHGDDNCELWLSEGTSPDGRRIIASVPVWTDPGDWTKFPEQTSQPVPLVAGRYYFIEALQKEGTGGDNLGVAWSYPGQARTYIPGSRLSPWQNLAPEPAADSAHLPPGGRVAIPVLVNDLDPNGSADLAPGTLALATRCRANASSSTSSSINKPINTPCTSPASGATCAIRAIASPSPCATG